MNNTTRVSNLPHALRPAGGSAKATPEATAKTLAQLGYAVPICDVLEVYVEAGSARVTVDGATAPVAATTGFPWLTDKTFRLSYAEALNLRCIIEQDAPVFQIQPYIA